jgi:predicted metal-dependent HD superfamily phosphohydrolase
MIEKYIELVKPFYDEPHRLFHNWDHIAYGLDIFKKLDTGTTEQVIAWLFHDIIYDPTKKDNEALSGRLARQMIKENGDDDIISLGDVSIIINDTMTHIPSVPISGLVLDIDMSSLADNDYNEFERQRLLAAKEYAFFGKDAVLAGTKAFIIKTLNQERIFTTDHFKPMEAIARSNLKKYLDGLEHNKQFNDIFPVLKKSTFKP